MDNMNVDIKSIAEKQIGLMESITEKQSSWSRQILLLSSTLFGVLIALQGKSSDMLGIRLCFALAIVALALGILLVAIATYQHIDNARRLRAKHYQKALDALEKRCEIGYVGVDTRKVFVRCEKIGYICLLSSVLLLALYAVLIAINT